MPGAISATPGTTESPSWASLTLIRHSPSRRSANDFVNSSGMCCVMTIPGASGGMTARMCSMATVPPVEAPMATIWFVVRASGCSGAAGPLRLCRRCRRPRTSAQAAAFTLSMSATTMSPTL